MMQRHEAIGVRRSEHMLTVKVTMRHEQGWIRLLAMPFQYHGEEAQIENEKLGFLLGGFSQHRADGDDSRGRRSTRRIATAGEMDLDA